MTDESIKYEFESKQKILEVRGFCSTKFIRIDPLTMDASKLRFNFSLF
jgi:hypothetical protein